jgi:hypothetical protein
MLLASLDLADPVRKLRGPTCHDSPLELAGLRRQVPGTKLRVALRV